MSSLSLSQKKQYGDILEQLAQSIDLTPTQYDDATKKYHAVADTLCAPGHTLTEFSPSITCQGSMRTGTPVRPVVEDEEFDVDLTCHLEIGLPEVQAKLKELVGDRFKEDATYEDMLEEKRRCWRLHYSESSKFHLDIVPAVLLKSDTLIKEGVAPDQAKYLAAITDNERDDYYQKTSNWPKSNPEGYAIWFLKATELDAAAIRNRLIEAKVFSDIARIPDYKVRTPLQRTVQLMKRHRDIMFDGNEDKPVSVIITTLAARAYTDTVRKMYPYGTSATFYDLLVATVKAMPNYIESRDGVAWVMNPVNPSENFADKWAEKKQKSANFFKWHEAFLKLLESPDLRNGLQSLAGELKTAFGTRAVNEAFQKQGLETRSTREDGLLKVTSAGIIGSAGIKVPNHLFDGKTD